MLPAFPQLRRLEPGDEEALRCVACQFPPYSDFNFVSLWSWHIGDRVMVAELSGNVVIKFTDYTSPVTFFMFLGHSRATETARTLIAHSEHEGMQPALKLIPQCVANQLDSGALSVIDDPDQAAISSRQEPLWTIEAKILPCSAIS